MIDLVRRQEEREREREGKKAHIYVYIYNNIIIQYNIYIVGG